MIKAVLNNIVVEPEFEPTKTKSGLYLKERKVQAAPNIGKVISVGGDVKNVKAGDMIIFHTKKNNPQGFKHDGKSYIHVTDDEVYGKL